MCGRTPHLHRPLFPTPSAPSLMGRVGSHVPWWTGTDAVCSAPTVVREMKFWPCACPAPVCTHHGGCVLSCVQRSPFDRAFPLLKKALAILAGSVLLVHLFACCWHGLVDAQVRGMRCVVLPRLLLWR